MKKRPKRKPAKPPPRRAPSLAQAPAPTKAVTGGRSGRAARPGPAAAPATQYKVVELSHVDEGALERTLNTWAAQGWRLDGVQFAMRESSRRPSMAFVVFTREGAPAEALRGEAGEGADVPDAEAARARLRRLAEAEAPAAEAGPDATLPPPGWGPVSAHERLRQLAGDTDDEGPVENVVMLDLAVSEGEEPLELAREVRPRRRPDADGPGEDP